MSKITDKLIKIIPNTRHGYENPLSQKPGCYCVEHNETGKVYIGSSANLGKRISQTTSSLRTDKHKNKNLQNLYNEHNGISIYVQTTETIETAQQLEQELVDKTKDTGLLCNIAVKNVVLTRSGAILTEKHKEILSAANKNRLVSEQTKERQSIAQKLFNSSEKGKELMKNKIQNLSRRVTIDGVEYSSISEASRSLNIPYTTLVRKYNL